MAYTVPSADDFKEFFVRDFPYGDESDVVMDADIERAITEAGLTMNEGLWDTQAAFEIGYLYLAAHNLVMNLRASSQGIAGQFSWLQTGKGAGSVNESLQIPQRILDNPELAILSKTPYGAKYLFLILPQLTGQVFTVCGTTLA